MGTLHLPHPMVLARPVPSPTLQPNTMPAATGAMLREIWRRVLIPKHRGIRTSGCVRQGATAEHGRGTVSAEQGGGTVSLIPKPVQSSSCGNKWPSGKSEGPCGSPGTPTLASPWIWGSQVMVQEEADGVSPSQGPVCLSRAGPVGRARAGAAPVILLKAAAGARRD